MKLNGELTFLIKWIRCRGGHLRYRIRCTSAAVSSLALDIMRMFRLTTSTGQPCSLGGTLWKYSMDVGIHRMPSFSDTCVASWIITVSSLRFSANSQKLSAHQMWARMILSSSSSAPRTRFARLLQRLCPPWLVLYRQLDTPSVPNLLLFHPLLRCPGL